MEESGRDSWSTQGLEELREGSQVIPHFPMDARRKTSVSNSSPRRFSKSLQFGHFPPVLQVRALVDFLHLSFPFFPLPLCTFEFLLEKMV